MALTLKKSSVYILCLCVCVQIYDARTHTDIVHNILYIPTPTNAQEALTANTLLPLYHPAVMLRTRASARVIG